MSANLILQLDERIAQDAQEYAQQHHVSLAQLVTEYLTRLTRPNLPVSKELPPITRSLVGALRGANANIDEQTYHAYLEGKYR